MTELFSIGPGNGDLNSFINRLQKWNINCVVDLRSKPYSEYVSQFNREHLANSLRNVGIEYLYFGDKLGGRPPEGFEKFRRSPLFKENIDLLLNQVKGKSAALMCSEFDISKCHRRFVVSEVIRKGINVTVIDREGNEVKTTLAPTPKKLKRRKPAVDSENQSKLTGFQKGD